MDFRLELHPANFNKKLNHEDALLLMGSCFTENMGAKLQAHKFKTLQNPHGILFNPLSVADALDHYIANRVYTSDDLFFFNERYQSWQHHSKYSNATATIALAEINLSINTAHKFLKTASYLFITLGSAFVYYLTDNAPLYAPNKGVANNHKAPANWFYKKLLDTDEATAILQDTMLKLKVFNPSLKVIFTISPVRHSREGLIDNNRSKAILITAVHKLVEQFEQAIYFPAYELVIDDLRDYRFYAEDLVHPNYAATNYVWEKFLNVAFLEDTRILMRKINEINAAMAHKPFNAGSEAHKSFVRMQVQKINELQTIYPQMDFSAELAFFNGQ